MPQTPPITARTGAIAIGAALPGAAARINPPRPPAAMPAIAPPVDAPLHVGGPLRDRVRGRRRNSLERRADHIVDRCCCRWESGRCRVVLFFDDVEDEAVAVARDRADEARLARVVAERAPDGADRLAERALGHDHAGPDAVEDLAAMHGLVAALDQQDQEIEVPGNERDLAALADEEPPLRRQREITEAISNQSG